jgi:hypothetical protein
MPPVNLMHIQQQNDTITCGVCLYILYKFLVTSIVDLFFSLGVGWDWIHLTRRALFGLFYQPQMIGDD